MDNKWPLKLYYGLNHPTDATRYSDHPLTPGDCGVDQNNERYLPKIKKKSNDDNGGILWNP